MIPDAFARWCQLRGIARLPAPPAVVAAFVTDCATLGAAQAWQALQEVSAEHVATGYADPTLGGPVALSMNALSGIAPPRSWPKTEWPRFHQLPYDLQVFVVDREADRDRAVRQAQNAAAAAAKGKPRGKAA